MMPAPQELLKEYVKSQNFTSTAEIMTAMKEMFRDVVQTAMEVELDEELGRERYQRAESSNTAPNYRNGYSHKTVKTRLGEVDIKIPRDRNGTFEPKLIGKYSRSADGMEEKNLALYSCGMSQRDIIEQIKELYDVEISPELVTKITEKIMPEVNTRRMLYLASRRIVKHWHARCQNWDLALCQLQLMFADRTAG